MAQEPRRTEASDKERGNKKPQRASGSIWIGLITALISGPVGATAAKWYFERPSLPPEVCHKPIFDPRGPNLDACIKKARELNKPYAIEDVLMHIKLESQPPTGMRSAAVGSTGYGHIAYVRTTYRLRALRKIESSERVFIERYTSSFLPQDKVVRWYGPQNEIDNTTDSSYVVPLELLEGQAAVVMTGADYHFPAEMPTRNIRGVTLGPKEDFWAYPNQEDVICALSIVVEAKDVAVHPINAAILVGTDGKITPSRSFQNSGGAGPGKSSVSARWQNVVPGDEALVYYAWQ